MTPRHRGRSIARAAFGCTLSIALLLCLAPAARAADVLPGWGQWWLPPDRSTHGKDIDSLFYWIFWITMITFVVVELVLVYFLIKYRYRADRKKGIFTHGNTRLEMAWTLAPALILAVLALGSKKVWDNYRYSPTLSDPNRAKVLVIGERFKWNIVYPGPDGKFGRYLIYPKPSDPTWPVGANGQPVNFRGVPGPASLAYRDAMNAIREYILNENPLGKDFADPDGKDDNFEKQPGRPMFIPVNRPVEVQLGSKDVIHDFFLPNFRVKLDAVPGMRGKVMFTATMTSKEMESVTRREYPIDEVITMLKNPANKELTIAIEEGMPGAENYKPPRGSAFMRYADPEKRTIVRHAGTITPDVAAKLKTAGVAKVTAYLPGYWDLVCEELCGEGHSKMQGQVIVVSQQEYDAMMRDKPSGAAPTTAPAVAMND